MSTPPYPDEPLPPQTVSLSGLVDLYSSLEGNPEGPVSPDYLCAVAAGRIIKEGTPARLRVSSRQETLLNSLDGVQMLRDIDSVIGQSRDLPYSKALAVFPVPDFKNTLTKNIHVKYRLSQEAEVCSYPSDQLFHIDTTHPSS